MAGWWRIVRDAWEWALFAVAVVVLLLGALTVVLFVAPLWLALNF